MSQSSFPRSQSLISRRDFFKRVGVGFAAALVIATDPRNLVSQVRASISAPTLWSKASFITRLNQVFRVNFGSVGAQPLTLVEVKNTDAKILGAPGKLVNAPADACYALVFSSARFETLTQGAYEFAHPELGAFPLFIVPGQFDSVKQYWVAIINHTQA